MKFTKKQQDWIEKVMEIYEIDITDGFYWEIGETENFWDDNEEPTTYILITPKILWDEEGEWLDGDVNANIFMDDVDSKLILANDGSFYEFEGTAIEARAILEKYSPFFEENFEIGSEFDAE